MKFPSHILLDFRSSQLSNFNQYWIFRFFSKRANPLVEFKTFSLHRDFIRNKEEVFNNFFEKKTYHFARHSSVKFINFNPTYKDKYLKSFFSTTLKVKNKDPKRPNNALKAFYYLNNHKEMFDKNLLKMHFKTPRKFSKTLFKSNHLWRLFNINFLRKERIYTKLKYSRVPQYDIVSGGSAALFAGFLGFLICEKFGFELLDSGDFYTAFMYFVFLGFILRLYLNMILNAAPSWSFLSPKWFIAFYQQMFRYWGFALYLKMK